MNLSPDAPERKRDEDLRHFVARTFGEAANDEYALRAAIKSPDLLSGGNNPKILLTGTFASGKTSIFEVLRLLDTIHPIAESARPLLDKFPELEVKPEFQSLLLKIQAAAEIHARQLSKGPILLDRGFLDIVVYSKYFKHSHLLPDLQPLIRYDHIYLCSPDGIDASHLYTSSDLSMRKSLHELFLDTLQELAIPHAILTGSTRDRLHTISEQLGNHPIAETIIREFALE